MGNVFTSVGPFSAHLILPKSEKAVNMAISGRFRIGSGVAITQVIKTS
jgi:hypothetical protein